MKNYVRLTCYEWKRIWMQPVVWVLLILCMIYNVYAFSSISVDSDARQVYAKVGEHLTEENYRILETNLQKKESGQRAVTQVQTEEGVKQYIEVPEWGGSYNVEYLSQALIQAQGILRFEENRMEMLEQAKNNMGKYQGMKGQEYSYRYNEMIYRQAAYRGELVWMETTGWRNLTQYLGVMQPVNLFDLTALLLCMVALCTLFAKDYELGIAPVLHTAAKGRGTLFFSKITAGVLFCITSLIVLRVSSLITLSITCDLSYITAPIQSLSNFQNCPYNISILGFLVLQFLIVILFLIFVFFVGCLFAILVKKSYVTLGIQFVVVAGLTALSLRPDAARYFNALTNRAPDEIQNVANHSQVGQQDLLKIFDPGMVMRINEYFDHYDYVNVFGFPISRLALMLTVLGFLTIALLLVSWYVYTHQKLERSFAFLKKREERHEESMLNPV